MLLIRKAPLLFAGERNLTFGAKKVSKQDGWGRVIRHRAHTIHTSCVTATLYLVQGNDNFFIWRGVRNLPRAPPKFTLKI